MSTFWKQHNIAHSAAQHRTASLFNFFTTQAWTVVAATTIIHNKFIIKFYSKRNAINQHLVWEMKKKKAIISLSKYIQQSSIWKLLFAIFTQKILYRFALLRFVSWVTLYLLPSMANCFADLVIIWSGLKDYRISEMTFGKLMKKDCCFLSFASKISCKSNKNNFNNFNEKKIVFLSTNGYKIYQALFLIQSQSNLISEVISVKCIFYLEAKTSQFINTVGHSLGQHWLKRLAASFFYC